VSVLRTVTITQPFPDKALNMNDRLDHWAKAKRVASWRDAAYWWAKQQRVSCRGALKPVEMWIEIGVSDPKRRRDPHNWFPTIKAICDGFTTAAVWADDDSTHLRTYEPTFTNDIAPQWVRLTLTWEVEV
jgi:crossover junction endodeoxyribonuclease RusA